MVLPPPRWTEAEYLAFERASDTKHEFIDGAVYLMAVDTENHHLIVISTSYSLYGQVRQRPCKVYTSDMRVKVSATGLFTYPDIVVVCGEPVFLDSRRDTLLNPTVVIEVLSPSTESYDRGRKFRHYRTLDSLREYLLIAQDSRDIDHYLRDAEGQWVIADPERESGQVALPSIECTLAFEEVYEKVVFEDMAPGLPGHSSVQKPE